MAPKYGEGKDINGNDNVEGVCYHCGCVDTKENPVTFGPDPYLLDIENDDTPVWECEYCRDSAGEDI